MGKKGKRRRGIPLLPNLLTTGNLLCGFFSLLNAHHGRLGHACLFVLVAAFLDLLDGRVARLTGSSTGFGKEFDSLADLVSFGVAPAFLAYTWGLEGNRIGGLTAFLFVVCGGLRLARFNIRGSSEFFEGLPIPMAGSFLCTFFLFCKRTGLESLGIPQVLIPLMFSLSFLMVSALPYPSFKQWDPLRRRPFGTLVLLILMVVVLLSEPWITLFLLLLVYVSLGPLRKMRRLGRVRSEETSR